MAPRQPIAAFGASTTWGWGSGSTNYDVTTGVEGDSYPTQLSKMSGWTVVNAGIVGDNLLSSSTHDSYATGLARFQAYLAANPSTGTIVCWIGINDLAGGSVDTDITSAYSTMISDASTAGIDIFFMTLQGAGWSAGDSKETYRESVNNWLRANHGQTGTIDAEDALAQGISHRLMLPQYIADGESQYPQSGYVHLSVIGYATVAQAAYEGLNSPNPAPGVIDYLSGGSGPMTVTAAQGGTVHAGMLLRVRTVLGAAPVASQTGFANSRNTHLSVVDTPSVANSLRFAVGTESGTTSDAAAETGTTTRDTLPDTTNTQRRFTGYATSPTPSPPVSETVGWAVDTTACVCVVTEVEPSGASPPTDDGTSPDVATTTGTTVTTDSFTPESGALLVAMVSSTWGTSETMTVSDSLGLTWTLKKQAASSGGAAYAGIFYAQAPVVVEAPGTGAVVPDASVSVKASARVSY